MAALDYQVQQIDITRWSTLTSILYYLQADGVKRLSISIDPLIDSSVIKPEEAYQITNS
jgi:hypothetical protein